MSFPDRHHVAVTKPQLAVGSSRACRQWEQEGATTDTWVTDVRCEYRRNLPPEIVQELDRDDNTDLSIIVKDKKV